MPVPDAIAQFVAWRIRAVLPHLAPRTGGRARHRVLSILNGGLGDKLMALPAVRHFRASHPDSESTLVIRGVTPPFLDGEADHFLTIAHRDTKALLRIAARRFDAVFVNSIGIYDVRCEIAATLARAPVRYGPCFDFQQPDRTIYNESFVFGEAHETLANFRAVGGKTDQPTLGYPLQLPPDSASPTDAPDILLHPGTSGAGLINRWPVESYAALAAELTQSGFTVGALGTPAEANLLARIPAARALNDLPLTDVARHLAAARLVIANDSGIGHLATAVGAHLITIMGANRPERVGPVGDHVTIIGPRCPYGGCYNNDRAAHCEMCIERISVAEVLDAARGVLDHR